MTEIVVDPEVKRQAHEAKVARLIASYPWGCADGYAVVLPDPVDDRTKGGLYVANAESRKALTGRVLAMGEPKILECGTRKPRPQWGVGDRVFFAAYSGQNLDASLSAEEKCIVLDHADVKLYQKK